jgi:hypothetical protein
VGGIPRGNCIDSSGLSVWEIEDGKIVIHTFKKSGSSVVTTPAIAYSLFLFY